MPTTMTGDFKFRDSDRNVVVVSPQGDYPPVLLFGRGSANGKVAEMNLKDALEMIDGIKSVMSGSKKVIGECDKENALGSTKYSLSPNKGGFVFSINEQYCKKVTKNNTVKADAELAPKILTAIESWSEPNHGLKGRILLGEDFKQLSKSIMGGHKFEHEEITEEWMSEFLESIFRSNDHSLKFREREVRDSSYIGTQLYLTSGEDKWEFDYMPYDNFDADREYLAADRDIRKLNRIILDFYGIKAHGKKKFSKAEKKARAQKIDNQIKKLQDKISALKGKKAKMALS